MESQTLYYCVANIYSKESVTKQAAGPWIPWVWVQTKEYLRLLHASQPQKDQGLAVLSQSSEATAGDFQREEHLMNPHLEHDTRCKAM